MREWSGDDYEKAAEVLAENKNDLPAFSDADGKVLLQRMVSTDNFTSYKNEGLPLAVRIPEVVKMMRGVLDILNLYITASTNKNFNCCREVESLWGFGIRAEALEFDLMAKYVPQIPHDDKYSVRMERLRQMSRGMMNVLSVSALGIRKNNGLDADGRSFVLRAMSD